MYVGWLVLVVAWIYYAFTLGAIATFSQLIPSLQSDFVNSDYFTLALIGSIPFGGPELASPLGTFFSLRFGNEKTIFVGVLILNCGLISSAFVNSVVLFGVTYGILVTIGRSLSNAPMYYLIADYFPYSHPRHVLATSIMTCAYPFGEVIFSQLNYLILGTYDWRGAFILYFILNATFGLLFCIIIHIKRNSKLILEIEKQTFKEDPEKQPLIPKDVPSHLVVSKRSVISLGAAWVLVSYFKSFSYYSPLFTMVKFSEMFGATESRAALLLTAYGASEVVSRTLASLIGDRIKGRMLPTYCFFCCLLVILNIVASFSTSTDHLLIYCILTGTLGGPIVAALYSSSAEVVNGLYVKQMYAAGMVGYGLGELSCPTIAGAVLTLTGDPGSVMLFLAGTYSMAAMLYGLIHLFNNRWSSLCFSKDIQLEESTSILPAG